MRNLLLMIAAVAILTSCNSSPESKANALIKEDLKKNLYHADTYDPVETKIDSAFSPKDNPQFYELLKEVSDIGNSLNELDSKAKQAKSNMALFSSPYMTEFTRNEYDRNKEEYNEYIEKYEKLKNKGLKKYQKLRTMLKEKPKFIGYRAIHSYRAQNNAGLTVFGNIVYIIDDKFEKIIFSCEKEEYDEIQDVIKEEMENMEEEDV